MHDKLLTDAEVAAYLRVSRQTIWRWVKDRAAFPQPVKIGPGTARWAKAEIEAYIATLSEN